MTETFSPPSSPPSAPAPPDRYRSPLNRGTLLADAPRVRLRWDALVDTHERICQAMSGVPPQTGGAPGFRLYWSQPSGMGWKDLAAPGDFAILGRHSECDGLMADDPTLPLRHLLATTVRLADGLALRLLDLQTGMPFYLGDDTARRSLVVSGSVAVSVGQQVVGAVPIEETDSGVKLALGPLYRPKVVEARTSQTLGPMTEASPYRSPGRSVAPAPRLGPGRLTLVTSMPPPRSFSDLAPRPQQALETGAEPSWPAVAAARVMVRRGKLMASVDLSAEQLEHGVILGRADRCLDQGLMAVLNNNTSRAHVLLLQNPQAPGILDVYDLCSTNGTYAQGQRVRRLRADAEGTVFAMGVREAAVSVTVRFPPPRLPE